MEPIDKMVLAYRRIREAKQKLDDDYKVAAEALQEKLDILEAAFLEHCKETGQTGGKTAYGTFSRRVKTRYWTNNWPAMYKLISEQNAPELLEQRIHQGNFKAFLEEHPEMLPEGLNVDSKYAITVTKPR